jgi:hypothetical protein
MARSGISANPSSTRVSHELTVGVKCWSGHWVPHLQSLVIGMHRVLREAAAEFQACDVVCGA